MRFLCVMVVVISLLIGGCSHRLSLIPRHGGLNGEGIAEEAGKKVTITLNGKTYTGQYVYGDGGVAFTNTFGNATAYSGVGTATAYGSSFSTTYVPGSGNGRILATSTDGDAIRCEFQYSSGGGLGVCEDNAGELYDLQIHN
jgi:hypothetical protein